MTDQEIRIFLTAAKLGSLTAAADALYMTQPAVSKHIKLLEEELGFMLFERHQGKRQVTLTDEGREFLTLAGKWNLIRKEMMDIASPDRKETLNVSAVGSVSSYILPAALQSFITETEWNLTFHNYHSAESYGYVGEGLIDLAIIADDMYNPNVETIPAFKEPMVLLATPSLSLNDTVHPSELNPAEEIGCSWTAEYDLWHSFWFPSTIRPKAELDQMSLMENFFTWMEGWAIAPLSVALSIEKNSNAKIHQMKDGPEDRIIYYLLGRKRKPALSKAFLSHLDRALKSYPEIESYIRDK